MIRTIDHRAPRRPLVGRVIAGLAALLLGLLSTTVAATPAFAAGSTLTGTFVDQVGNTIAGVDVDIWTFSGGFIETLTSDARGDFSTTLPDGADYYYWVHQNSTDGAGVEVGLLSVTFSIAGANLALGNVVLKRAVPVSGTITNWTPGMGNVRVQVGEAGGSFWSYESEATSTGATFSVPTLLDDGEYTLFFILANAATAPNVDAFLGGEYFDHTAADTVTATAGTPLSGITMTMPPAALISGFITDKATGLPIPDVYVAAESETGGE